MFLQYKQSSELSMIEDYYPGKKGILSLISFGVFAGTFMKYKDAYLLTGSLSDVKQLVSSDLALWAPFIVLHLFLTIKGYGLLKYFFGCQVVLREDLSPAPFYLTIARSFLRFLWFPITLFPSFLVMLFPMLKYALHSIKNSGNQNSEDSARAEYRANVAFSDSVKSMPQKSMAIYERFPRFFNLPDVICKTAIVKKTSGHWSDPFKLQPEHLMNSKS